MRVHTSCAIFRVRGLARGAKYQVFADGEPVRGWRGHPDHPDHQYFVGATRTRCEAWRMARRFLNPRSQPPKRLLAIIRRKETR